jgi:hypothetical protein
VSPPIVLAGTRLERPDEIIRNYLREHRGTVANFDAVAGSFAAITSELVRATRHPWMNSRISHEQASWLVERGKGAPWDLVPRTASLLHADAAEIGGLYDRAITLWDWFWDDRPYGLGLAKLSKVLFLMRPSLVPILDSHLTGVYRTAARAAAAEVKGRRQDSALGRFRYLYWEAIRTDLVRNEAALAAAREEVASHLEFKKWVQSLSSLRLLDMVAWKLSS